MVNERTWYGLLQNGALVVVMNSEEPMTVDDFHSEVGLPEGSKWDVVEVGISQIGGILSTSDNAGTPSSIELDSSKIESILRGTDPEYKFHSICGLDEKTLSTYVLEYQDHTNIHIQITKNGRSYTAFDLKLSGVITVDRVAESIAGTPGKMEFYRMDIDNA